MRRKRYPLLFIPTQQQKLDTHPQQAWLGVRCGLYTIHWDPRWWKSRCTWSTSFSTDTSGIHLQTQKILRNTSWEPDHKKRIYRTTQHSVRQRKEGKNKKSEKNWICSWGWGTEAGTELHGRETFVTEVKHWGCWRVKQLICVSLNGVRITQSILATATHTPDRDASPLESAAAWSWKRLESSPRARSAVDWREVVWENLREESAVGYAYEGKPANLEAGWYCWVTHRGWNHLCSLSLCTYQHQTAETTQLGWPFKDLMCKATQNDPSQGDL